MSSTAAGDEFSRLTGAMFSMILSMDDARGAMGDRLGIGITGLKTLSILNRHGAMSAGSLATSAGITSGSMTSTIDKLVSNGFASRLPSPTDGRRVVVQITSEGAEAMNWVLGYYFEALGASLPIAEIESVSNYLDSTAHKLRQLTERVPKLPRD